ncbi:hypothetical protein ACLOJK_038811 [Asimina triloba]
MLRIVRIAEEKLPTVRILISEGKIDDPRLPNHRVGKKKYPGNSEARLPRRENGSSWAFAPAIYRDSLAFEDSAEPDWTVEIARSRRRPSSAVRSSRLLQSLNWLGNLKSLTGGEHYKIKNDPKSATSDAIFCHATYLLMRRVGGSTIA